MSLDQTKSPVEVSKTNIKLSLVRAKIKSLDIIGLREVSIFCSQNLKPLVV